MVRSRLHRTVLIGTGGMLVILLLLVAMFRFAGPMLGPAGRIVAGTAGAAVLVLWWGVFAGRVSGAQDEYQRWMEHRAWYSGGLVGLMASAPVYAFIGLGGLTWLNLAPAADPASARAFTTGYMLPLMLQMAGSALYGLWGRVALR